MISHRHETVFVHVPKTGGQSVETVFLRDLGLAWQDRGVLLLRHNDDPAAGPEKLAHLYAEEYVRLGHLPGVLFRRYLSFAVVRHPYDRAVSEYCYRAGAQAQRGRAVPSLDDFLALTFPDDRSDRARHLVPQVRFVMDDTGTSLVDHVLRFETLERDIAPLFARLFGGPRILPHKNRAPTLPQVRLTADQKALLQVRYGVDFEAFGYDP